MEGDMHFDQNRTIGALGTLIAAKWYRSENPHSLLISLDSVEARRWMNLVDDAKRADLLGLTVEHGKPVIDILEVKSGEDATAVYSLHADGTITGKPVEQLLNTGKSVGAIFGLNTLETGILTPPRREILRNHLYRQGFSGHRTPKEKQEWGDLLNALFQGEIHPVVQMDLVVVNFGLNKEPMDKVFKAGESKVHVVHLNEEAVSIQLGSSLPTSVDAELQDHRTEVSGRKHNRKDGYEKQERQIQPSRGKKIKPKETASPKTKARIGKSLQEEIATMCGRLRAACQDFSIRVSEIDPSKVDIGPSVLRYKLKLSPGEQGEKLRRQAENIARQLAANSVPIIEFLRGTEYMYLDLARPDREVVYLEPLLKSTKIENANELPLHVGIDPSGQRYTLDLGDDRLPHLLVAGGTGSGKTIFLYSVILSLVSVHSARELELLIIDPKQTDFAVFGSLPHLRGQRVITDAAKGVESLQAIVAHDLQQRSETLQKARCRDIKTFNLSQPKKPMPPLVVVIDEYADLVAVLPKKEREEFDRVVSRLAARGRNVGIHLVIATQRPTADVVTGNIKANMPCRISFSLPSSRDSQVILDEPGAERLLRNGDMLLLLEGQLTRLQGYFVDIAGMPSLIHSCS
jgi:DNA segregation ATPase FtsK/SpoIIIE-like protein